MQGDLRVKRAIITYAEVPLELVSILKEYSDISDQDDDLRFKKENINVVRRTHQLVERMSTHGIHFQKEQLAELLQRADYPSFRPSCDIVILIHKRCASNTFFGRSFYKEQRTKDHELPDDTRMEKTQIFATIRQESGRSQAR